MRRPTLIEVSKKARKKDPPDAGAFGFLMWQDYGWFAYPTLRLLLRLHNPCGHPVPGRHSMISRTVNNFAGQDRPASLPGILRHMQQLRDLFDRITGRNASGSGSEIEDAMTAFDAGVEAFESGGNKKAITFFTRAIELSPTTYGIYQHRGSAYAASGRHLEAIVDYDVAIRLNPSYPDTYVDRGNSQHALEEYERAIKDYSEAIRLRPNFAEAYANRAAVHVESGDEAAAAVDIESAYANGIDREALDELLAEARRGR